jgi:hypothetical protein
MNHTGSKSQFKDALELIVLMVDDNAVAGTWPDRIVSVMRSPCS